MRTVLNVLDGVVLDPGWWSFEVATGFELGCRGNSSSGHD